METTSDMVNASYINYNLNTFCNIFSLISKENDANNANNATFAK